MRTFPFFCFLLFPCLLLAAGRESAGQNRQDSLREAVYGAYQNIEAPMMTGDGNWLALRKRSWIPAWTASDLDKDTVLLFDLARPGKNKLAGYRLKVRGLAFVGNSYLLLSGERQTELLDLKEQTSTYYQDVKQIQVLKDKRQFVLLYGPQEKNKLELRGNNGELINTLDSVDRFYKTEQGPIYAITENEKNQYDIFCLSDSQKEKVYDPAGKILSIDIDPGERGMMVHEQSPDSERPGITYLDFGTKTSYPLNEALPVAFMRGFTEIIQEGNTYFLKLWQHWEKQDSLPVDIWYGQDNRLEEKFLPPVDVLTFVWEPRTHFIRQVGTDHLSVSINTGNNRYFICYDPDRLQDYRTEHPPLMLSVYDLAEDRYELLDTIAPELYLSRDGVYGLSPAKSGWDLYDLPSGTKKHIEGQALGIPWFTTDGSSVLFEGDGAVWQYDLKTATLSPLVTFDGYQTHIVNGQRMGLNAPKGTFAKQQADLSQPLLIKLYDPERNRTGYSLWHNGKPKVIIPPTTKRIQSLGHNRQFTRFSWLEEDYNLPPRLVYKEMGKAATVVYQSNEQDKAILSLKQEIIPYTTSDSIPLKGILYYPLGYSPSMKYPMVVRIYEKQNQLANRYPYPSYCESLGFNIRLFLDDGYFVYLPDIVIQGKEGPGVDALDCVHRAVDALVHNPLVDRYRIGLIGHSFGGYETDYIATRSDRFAAFVSGSGHSDIVWDANSFNYAFDIPDYVRIKGNMYQMGVPFSAAKGLYFKNNPVYHAEKVNAPVLLWTGLEDQNVTADHSMAFYNALRRNGKDVAALFYRGEGHSLQEKHAQVDLTCRILDWFDYFLKDRLGIGWIDKREKRDAR